MRKMKYNKRSKKGMTLVEMIVAMALTSIFLASCVVILHVTTSSLWASADLQKYQDQAYVLATSMGDSIDDLVDEGKINIASYNGQVFINDSTLPASSVTAQVKQNADGNYEVTVTATSGNGKATYIYKATYRGSGTSYTRVY